MYAFVGVQTETLPDFDDQQFALDLLEHKHVLVAPGTSFNVPYRNHFRITNLPEPQMIADVFGRMEELLRQLRGRRHAGHATEPGAARGRCGGKRLNVSRNSL